MLGDEYDSIFPNLFLSTHCFTFSSLLSISLLSRFVLLWIFVALDTLFFGGGGIRFVPTTIFSSVQQHTTLDTAEKLDSQLHLLLECLTWFLMFKNNMNDISSFCKNVFSFRFSRFAALNFKPISSRTGVSLLLTFQSLLVTWCTNSLTFNNCTLCPHCIYVFCIYLRTNSDLCHLQHKLIGFYNRDEKCLLRGTDWVFK